MILSMKNLSLIKTIIMLSIGLAVFNTSYAYSTHERDNLVEFNYKDAASYTTLKVTGFDVKGYSVTSGQPWDGVSVTKDSELDVKAGRKGDNDNNDILINNGYTPDIEASTGNVNFAIIGDLHFSLNTVPYVCSNIVIEQAYVNISDMRAPIDINVWFIYSNNKNAYSRPASFVNPDSIAISCQTQQANEPIDFIISSAHHNDSGTLDTNAHLFNIYPQ